MKEELKKIIFMGLGAMSLTNEKAGELKEDLVTRGQEAFEHGKVLNEELKHDIQEKIKENVSVTIVQTKDELSVDELLEQASKLSEEDRKKLKNELEGKDSKKNGKKETK